MTGIMIRASAGCPSGCLPEKKPSAPNAAQAGFCMLCFVFGRMYRVGTSAEAARMSRDAASGGRPACSDVQEELEPDEEDELKDQDDDEEFVDDVQNGMLGRIVEVGIVSGGGSV